MCAECGKAFKDNHTLKNHLGVHSDQKPFQCSECPSKFRRKGGLKIHMAVHYSGKHVCNICGKLQKSKSSLFIHLSKSPALI